MKAKSRTKLKAVGTDVNDEKLAELEATRAKANLNEAIGFLNEAARLRGVLEWVKMMLKTKIYSIDDKMTSARRLLLC